MKRKKPFKTAKQAALAACITFLLLFTCTACGEKAPGEAPTAPEGSSAPVETPAAPDPTQAPAEAPAATDPSQTPAEAPAATDPTQAPAKAPAATDPAQKSGQTWAQITLDEAKGLALANAGLDSSAVTYTKEKLDYEDGIAVYEIDFYTATHEYEYEIDAADGSVYSMHTEAFDSGHSGHSHHSGNNTSNSNASTGNPSSGSSNTTTEIGIENAKSIALEHAGFSASDVTFKKAKSDTEDGQSVYELEFYQNGREYEYTILAADGRILEYEVD